MASAHGSVHVARREWLAVLAAIMTADPAAAVEAARVPSCLVELVGQLDSDDAAVRRDAASTLAAAAAAAEGRPQRLDILRQAEALPGLAALLAREGTAAQCPAGCATCWGAAAAADALTAASGGAAAGELGRRLMAALVSLVAIAHQLEAPGAPSLLESEEGASFLALPRALTAAAQQSPSLRWRLSTAAAPVLLRATAHALAKGLSRSGGGGGGGGDAGAGPDAGAPGRQEGAVAFAHLEALAVGGAISRGALTPRERADVARRAALAAAPGLEAALRLRCGALRARGAAAAPAVQDVGGADGGGGFGAGAELTVLTGLLRLLSPPPSATQAAAAAAGEPRGAAAASAPARNEEPPAPSSGGSGSGGAGPSGGGAPGVQQGPAAVTAQPPLPGCLHCGSAAGPGGARLKVCRGCRAVRFCSQDCYVCAWRGGHREACAALRAAREEEGGAAS
ncbi:MAG: hypothetical protein J3K34DRAFT_468753 [Monoraphidium minutum]|nr:MAG: hypothetical protein J3K34DRAFT_468753 [Monoraphidium minutum]